MQRFVLASCLVSCLTGLLACGDDDGALQANPVGSDAGARDGGTTGSAGSSGSHPDAAVDGGGEGRMQPKADLQELLDLGIEQYLGAAEPTGSEMISGVSGVIDGSVAYDFDPADGPVCMRGAPYSVSLLDQGSDNLMIYLQGGGACVSILCRATTEVSPRGVPKLGVLDVDDADNPVGSWNIVFVPYCDGSVFGGDNDFENPDDAEGVRLHHGQRNFSAALDLALAHFPHPKKVLLAGSSAGGWGTVYHRALVRSQYPDAELSVMDDAGIGFMVNSDYVSGEWGSATRYRPPSCDECQTDQHMSPFVKYVLEHDPAMVVGDFSSWEDSVIMSFTLTSDPMAFRTMLKSETDIPASAFPDRYKRFFVEGSAHTTLLSGFHTTQVDGVTIAEWLKMMIDRDPDWAELIE